MAFTSQKPARYYPLEKGVYEIGPNLRSFGTDFGNGELDQKIFQFDSSFTIYRNSKLACRAERLEKYYREQDFDQATIKSMLAMIIERLVTESPQLFRLTESDGSIRLDCLHTQEALHLDSDYRLTGVEALGGQELPKPAYISAYDAIAMQLAEDICVLRVDPENKKDWLAACHVCNPSHWRPEEKTGKSFFGIHQPIPECEKSLLRPAHALATAMVRKGPYVRFVWGLTTNPQPNHHPDVPQGVSELEWKGPPLTAILEGTRGYLWCERQVVWGNPDANASLFTIRPYFTPLEEIRSDEQKRELLRTSILSMSPAVRGYKRIEGAAMDAVLKWLDQ